MPTRKNNSSLLIGVVLFVALMAVVLLFFLGRVVLKRNIAPPPVDTELTGVLVTPTPLPEEKGFIEGSLSFPSEAIPDDMKVCTETLDGRTIVCTEDQIKDPKYTYGAGYKLETPIGQYYVYANTNDRLFYKAYYSEYVTCGLSVNCTSHKPLVVEVKEDETTSSIDPQDWYNQ